ncbi:MAG: ferrochelatase 2 [Acidimicrobiales bacterium]|nr:MAG: ferrochelatase 2 [Acidimicrobiales bacterium]
MTILNGLLVMAYGSPESMDEIGAFYTHIRGGNPPAPHEIADLRRRYEAVGGVDHLRRETFGQAEALATVLDEEQPGKWLVRVGMRHSTPFIEDAVEDLVDSGVARIVGLVLAPHWSRASVGEYERRMLRAVAGRIRAAVVPSWYSLDAVVSFHAEQVRRARMKVEAAVVLFSAHSLPLQLLMGDPYPQQLFDGAKRIAERAGLRMWQDWACVWQSAGRRGADWAAPDVSEVIRMLATTSRRRGVIVCPHGFASEHLEVLYDLDIEARTVAEGLGLEFWRTPTVGRDPSVTRALARAVLREADPASSR